ncbi:MAG: response regulator [Pseudomonadota bacterium]
MSGDYNILVVDNNSINQFILTEMLSYYDASTDVAPSGSRAVEMVESGDYDAVFMDILMPGMTGIEAISAIRDMTLPKQPRIIAVSVSTSDKNINECRNAGADDFLDKPIGINTLFAMLETHLPGIRHRSV